MTEITLEQIRRYDEWLTEKLERTFGLINDCGTSEQDRFNYKHEYEAYVEAQGALCRFFPELEEKK